jgi:HEAT repeat protein
VPIPHERIRAQVDWSWTPVLLERLLAADDAERAEVADTLGFLCDPRSVVPLRALVLDPTVPASVRWLASGLLRDELLDEPDDAMLRGLWASDDPVLRAHALRSMRPAQADLVVAVAADPAHALHADGLAAMGFGFERPTHHRLVIDALAHADPAVRSIAATTLLWDEPWAAEAALIAALDDPARAVARSAADTLCYYRSQRALRALTDRPGLAAGGTYDVDGLARAFVEAVLELPEPARPALRRWLAPIEDLVRAAEADADAEPAPAPPPVAPEVVVAPVDVDHLLAAIAGGDGPRAAVRAEVRAVVPEHVAAGADRARLARAMVDHVDPELRQLAAVWCGRWGLTGPLCALLADPARLVRKSAAWAFALAPPDPALAPLLRAQLDAVDTVGVQATETLRSYAHHAGRDPAIAALTAIGHDHPHESLVLAAIHALIEREAGEALAGLLWRLTAAPLVTWSVHVALLEAARRFALAVPGADQLGDVDQLDVQVELARRTVAG